MLDSEAGVESNPLIEVLQTSAFPLGYPAVAVREREIVEEWGRVELELKIAFVGGGGDVSRFCGSRRAAESFARFQCRLGRRRKNLMDQADA